MKKLFTMALAALLVVGCSSAPKTETTASPEATKETTEATASTMVGIGSVTSMNLTDATADKEGSAQANTTIATIVLDGDVIKSLKLDQAQNTVKFDTKGVVTSDKEAATPTKAEKGADYGMKVASAIGKEWFEQAAAFEEYAVGKTVAEVLATPATGSEDLKTSVTIDVAGFVSAVEVASKNAKEVKGAVKVGTASITAITDLADAGEKEGGAKFNTTYAVIAEDADGKIAYLVIDTAQNGFKFDTKGVITSDKAAPTLTKKEKGADYGMKVASAIGKEWFEQVAAFEEYAVGKTVAEVLATPTTGSEDLKTSVTIDLGAFLSVVEKAASAAVEVK